MIGNHIIQADLVTAIKGEATITDLLDSASEVREAAYQGAAWAYPTIRLRIVSQIAIIDREQCDHARLIFSVLSFVENASSREANVIGTAVNKFLHRKNFQGTGWYSWFRSRNMANPAQVSEKLWMADSMYEGVVYPTA